MSLVFSTHQFLSTGMCLKVGILYFCLLTSFKIPSILREFFEQLSFLPTTLKSLLETVLWQVKSYFCEKLFLLVES